MLDYISTRKLQTSSEESLNDQQTPSNNNNSSDDGSTGHSSSLLAAFTDRFQFISLPSILFALSFIMFIFNAYYLHQFYSTERQLSSIFDHSQQQTMRVENIPPKWWFEQLSETNDDSDDDDDINNIDELLQLYYASTSSGDSDSGVLSELQGMIAESNGRLKKVMRSLVA